MLDYIGFTGGQLLAEYAETESGRNDDRQQLKAAIAHCRQAKATLLVAKLDRLARSVSFVSSVMDSDVPVVAADNPHASRLVLHMLAAVSEFEREQISTRTKAALAAAKARGVVLGKHGRILAQRRKGEAMEFALSVCNHLQAARDNGAQTLQEISCQLNAQGLTTRRGGVWSASAVWKVQNRMRE